MIQRLLGMMQLVQHKYQCGTDTSKMGESLLKEIHLLEGLRQAEPLRTSNVYGLQSAKIGD